MPLAIQPPWPPASYVDPLPYDQRGCCWPWGPCGRIPRLETRLLLLGERADGPVGAGWGDIATGVMAVVDVAVSDFLNVSFVQDPSSLSHEVAAAIYSDDGPEGPWFADMDILGSTPGPWFLIAFGLLFPNYCSDGSEVLVDTAFGPPDPPQIIRVRWLRWFQPSPYP